MFSVFMKYVIMMQSISGLWSINNGFVCIQVVKHFNQSIKIYICGASPTTHRWRLLTENDVK